MAVSKNSNGKSNLPVTSSDTENKNDSHPGKIPGQDLEKEQDEVNAGYARDNQRNLGNKGDGQQPVSQGGFSQDFGNHERRDVNQQQSKDTSETGDTSREMMKTKSALEGHDSGFAYNDQTSWGTGGGNQGLRGAGSSAGDHVGKENDPQSASSMAGSSTVSKSGGSKQTSNIPNERDKSGSGSSREGAPHDDN